MSGLDTREFCIWGSAVRDSVLRLRSDTVETPIDVKMGRFGICRPFTAKWDHDLVIHLESGAIAVDRVALSAYTESSGIYEVDGTQGPFLEGVRRLNASIGKTSARSSYAGADLASWFRGVYGDQWMGPSAEGQVKVPAESGKGERVLVIKTNPRPSTWGSESVLTVSMDEKVLGSVACGRPMVFPIPKANPASPSDAVKELRIDATNPIVPAQNGFGQDVRSLTCQIVEIHAQPR